TRAISTPPLPRGRHPDFNQLHRGGEGPGEGACERRQLFEGGVMSRRRPTSRNLPHARELRTRMTVPEQKLWRVLRGRRLAGLKFIRQAPIERSIVDFACRSKRLIVEVDGDSHADRATRDGRRQQALEAAGWT